MSLGYIRWDVLFPSLVRRMKDRHICWWSLEGSARNRGSHSVCCRWLACRSCWGFPWSPQPTRLSSSRLDEASGTGVVEHVFVLLNKLLRPEVAILVEKVDFQDLLAVWGVGIGEDVGHKEREDVPEGPVADVGREDVVVVGVEELRQQYCTNKADKPPP